MELENVIANACMMVSGEVIDVADLPEGMKYAASAQASTGYELISMEEVNDVLPSWR